MPFFLCFFKVSLVCTEISKLNLSIVSSSSKYMENVRSRTDNQHVKLTLGK
jgi:hypothetical protein